MAESLGTIRGQIVLDVKQALASYTETRLQHLNTVTALSSGAGAMQASGAAIAGVGAVMVGGFMVAVQAASEFERKLDYFGAVSASTQAEYDAIREKALQLGADTIFSADQIADSFVELGKSGVSAKDIIDGIGEGVANLSAAADIPLDTAANIITGAVATYQLGADRAVSVADQLAGAANASTVDVEDLGVSLKYAGGVAASLGVSFEETNTALALLGKFGIKGSTAGTSLRQVLLGLNGSTKKAKNALEDLGIITEDGSNKFYNANGSAKSLSEVFQILQDSTAGMSDQQRTATMQQIFATRALPSLIALTNAGADGFDKMAAEVEKTTAMEVAGKRLDNLSGDIEVLRGNIDTLLISGGSGFQGFARTLVQGVTGMLQSFLELDASTQQLIFTIIGITGAVLVVVGGMGMFAGSLLNVINLAIRLAPAVKLMVDAVKGLAIVKTIAGAFAAFNTVLLANPIILIVTLIAVLVAALIYFFTQTETGKQAWASFTRFLGEAWANIVSVATTIFTTLGTFFSDVWTNITNVFNSAIEFIKMLFFNFTPLGLLIANFGAIVTFFQTVWTNITTGISNFVTGAIAFFAALPQNILSFFLALPGMIGYALGFLLGTIVRVFIAIGTWLVTNVPIIINSVITFFSQLPGKVYVFFVNLLAKIVAWGVGLVSWAMTAIPAFVNSVVNFMRSLPTKIFVFFVQLVAGIVRFMNQARAQAISIASALIAGVINFFQTLPARALGLFSQLVSTISNALNTAKSTAISMASQLVAGFVNGIQALPGLAMGIFNNIVGAIRGAISGAFSAVRDFAAGMWEGFKDGLGIHSPSYIEHAMWAITDVTAQETKHLKKQVRTLQGLGNGISEIGNDLGFGDGMSTSLQSLYKTVAATKDLDAQLAGSASTLGVESSAKLSMDGMAKKLDNLKQEVHINTQVENPVPEKASETLPRVIRDAAEVI